MANIILTKKSSPEEIRCYFNAILKLSQSGEEFPVDFNEVWPLVYSQKGHALRELRRNFIDEIDFNLSQNGKVVSISELKNGIEYKCHLSLPCMEFLIARKVRPVFEVYRTVFHSVVAGNTMPVPVDIPTETPEVAVEFQLPDIVRFIALCRQIGFPEADVADMAEQIAGKQKNMEGFVGLMMVLRQQCGMSDTSLRRIALRYAGEHGLPLPRERQAAPVERAYEKRKLPRKELPHQLLSTSQLLRLTKRTDIKPERLNRSLHECGILTKVIVSDPKDSLGMLRTEWQVTKDGELYGRNSQTRCGRYVRPKWWADRFYDLLQLCGLDAKEENGKEVAL